MLHLVTLQSNIHKINTPAYFARAFMTYYTRVEGTDGNKWTSLL
jgi:hypothetical protein